jgi:hypothetical protein
MPSSLIDLRAWPPCYFLSKDVLETGAERFWRRSIVDATLKLRPTRIGTQLVRPEQRHARRQRSCLRCGESRNLPDSSGAAVLRAGLRLCAGAGHKQEIRDKDGCQCSLGRHLLSLGTHANEELRHAR